MKVLVGNIIGNYYGVVELVTSKTGKYYLTLGDYDEPSKVRISEELAKALLKEFETKE